MILPQAALADREELAAWLQRGLKYASSLPRAIARPRMADSARRYARRAAHEVGTEKPEIFPADQTNVSASGYGERLELAKVCAN
jgi:hypothetical protein